MKYLRTNDGRILKWLPNGYIEESNGTIVSFGFFTDYDDYYLEETRKIINKHFHTEIFKQADTIEELCDRVVVKDSNNKEPRVYSVKKYNWRKMANTLFNIRKVEWVKFAIWTDKGLTYVADLYEEGNLELL